MNPFVITLALWTVVVGAVLLASSWMEQRRQGDRNWLLVALCGVIVTTAGVVLFLSEAGAL